MVFVCEGNSCRSVMAEALAKHVLGAQLRVQSAGTDPEAMYDSQNASMTLQSMFGLSVRGHRQTNVRDLDLDKYTYVIAMDSAIAKSLAKLTRRSIVTWSIQDPWGRDPVEYHQCALKILEHIQEFATLIRGSDTRKKKRAQASR